MRRHELDPVSLTFGFAFAGLGLLFLLGQADQAVRLRWIWPVLLLVLGAGILIDISRGTRDDHAPTPERDPASDDPHPPTPDPGPRELDDLHPPTPDLGTPEGERPPNAESRTDPDPRPDPGPRPNPEPGFSEGPGSGR